MSESRLYAAQLAVLSRYGEIQARRDGLVDAASQLLGDDIPEATGIRVEVESGAAEASAPAVSDNPITILDAAEAELESAASFLPRIESEAVRLRQAGVARQHREAQQADLFVRAPLAAFSGLAVWLVVNQVDGVSVFWGTLLATAVIAVLLLGPLGLKTMSGSRLAAVIVVGLGALNLFVATESLGSRMFAALAAGGVAYLLFFVSGSKPDDANPKGSST